MYTVKYFWFGKKQLLETKNLSMTRNLKFCNYR